MTGSFFIPVSAVKPGTKLVCDDGFTFSDGTGCLLCGQIVEVKMNDAGQLYVPCAEGEHTLDGQLTDDCTHYVGFQIVEGANG